MTDKDKSKLFTIINNHFDKVFVLSLKRSVDRQEMVKKTLKGLDFDFFWGVDGKELNFEKMIEDGSYQPSLTKLLKNRKGETVKNLTLPQIACAMSHNEIRKEVVNKGFKNAVIFEDDIILQGNGIDKIEAAISELPNDWDLLYFGHHGSNSDPSVTLKIQIHALQLFAKLSQRFERLRVLNPDTIGRWLPRPYSKNLNFSGSHHGAYAYAVSHKGAEKILSYTKPTVVRNDNLLAELTSYGWLNSFNTKNIVFYPNRDIPSTINDLDYHAILK